MIDFTLMKHQEDAIYRATFKKDLYLAWETGTGKTCTIIQIIRDKIKEIGRIRKTIILAPKVVLSNWKSEFKKFSGICPEDIYILKGSLKDRIEFVESLGNFSAILITNYDAFQNVAFTNALSHWGPEIIVCDEAHTLKNHRSKRAQNVSRLTEKTYHNYLLSGTPILNNSLDLFMQYQVMDGGKTFGKNFYAYRSRYFEDSNAAWSSRPGHFPKFVPRKGSMEELSEKIKISTLIAKKTECLDLPELVTQDLEVEMGPEQIKAYSEMKKYFLTYINGEAVVAMQAVTKALRLQQIVSGFVKTDTGEIIRLANVPRMEVLKDQLEVLTPTNKVIVWACFRENYNMIREVCRDLGIKAVELHGEVKDADREEALRAFESDPDVRVLIGNQGAGGIGVNLVSATYSIYYSRGFKLGDDIQSRGRNYRRGSEVHDKITHINLVTPNTIDKLISDVLASKLDIGNQILDYLKQKGRDYGIS